MAVRLQMKLGVVPDADRVSDSPDTLVVVEPNVGSVARSTASALNMKSCCISPMAYFISAAMTIAPRPTPGTCSASATLRACSVRSRACARFPSNQ